MADEKTPAHVGQWSARVSGNATDRDLINQLRNKLADLLGKVEFGLRTRFIDDTARGWVAELAGAAPDPNDHPRILSAIRAAVSDPALEAGSSEFASPHVNEVNFHVASPSTVPDQAVGAEGGAVAAGAASAAGVPEAP